MHYSFVQQNKNTMTFTKLYPFAKVSATCHIYETDYNQGNQIISVSTRGFSETLSFFRERNTVARHIPLNEDGDMGFGNLLSAVRLLLSWDKKGKRTIVCSEIGNYNNRVVIEAFHYAKMGFHYDDRCRGYQNHLIYHSMYGHLPPLPQIEYELKRLGEQYNPNTKETLEKIKKTASNECYNDLAKKTEEFIRLIKGLNVGDDKYENLSPIMSCFSQIKMKDGYVLDGFQAGLPHFDSSMYLHARKKCGKEFVPFDWNKYHKEWFIQSLKNNTEESEKLKEFVRQYFKDFDDTCYVRKPVCSWHAKEFVQPIWKDITVPFNRDGIWEAALLYIAPRLMSGDWHWIYCRITPVTSDAVLASKCKTLSDYKKFTGSEALSPRVNIIDDENAVVHFTAWGHYGLKSWKLKVTKDGTSVNIEWDRDEQKDLIYYEPKFVV